MGMIRFLTTAYHSQADGQTEVLNQSLEISLSAYVGLSRNDWVKYLDALALSYNTTPHTATTFAPAYLLRGYILTTRSTLIYHPEGIARPATESGSVKTRLTLTDFLLYQVRSEFRSFRIGRSFRLDIMGGSERRCGFSLCAAPSLTSRRLNLRRVGLKNDKGKSLRRQGGKELKLIFELANTSSIYSLYTK